MNKKRRFKAKRRRRLIKEIRYYAWIGITYPKYMAKQLAEKHGRLVHPSYHEDIPF